MMVTSENAKGGRKGKRAGEQTGPTKDGVGAVSKRKKYPIKCL